MNIQQIENELIEAGKAYRQFPNKDITMFYDGTPFKMISEDRKARAILHNGKWAFVAAHSHRFGFCSEICNSLEIALKSLQQKIDIWEIQFEEKLAEQKRLGRRD